jgi:hypothetical protein
LTLAEAIGHASGGQALRETKNEGFFGGTDNDYPAQAGSASGAGRMAHSDQISLGKSKRARDQTLSLTPISILAFSNKLSVCFRIMLNRPPGDDDLS